MAEETLRRSLDRAFDPGPDFPDRLLLSRTMAMLDKEIGATGRGTRWKSQRRTPPSWLLPRAVLQLAAGALIVVLVAAAVAAFLEFRYRGPESTPAGLSPKAYQAMVSRDVTRFDSSGDGTSCATLQSTCPMPGRPVLAALQRWLDDLNRSEAPARFTVIDGQLRPHLAATISVLNAVVAAYQAQDQSGLDRANNDLQHQADWLDSVAASIAASQQGTLPAYIASIRAGNQAFGACASCQSLMSTSQPDCAGIQTLRCENDVFAAMSAIESFEATVVRDAAPSSLASEVLGLQLDLANADTALLAMEGAELTGDQAGFTAGRQLLQQALPAIDTDVAGIVGA
jgi:hypothetical protein